MKMRYQTYDKELDNSGFLSPNDRVNVFINFESILKNLSMVKDLDKKLILEREFPTILTAESLNLMAHYKRFFKQNGLETRVFLYYTDLTSDNYVLSDVNEDYRSYYNQKYLYNPKFNYLGTTLIDRIIPEIKTISEFLNGVYFITAHNFEGSLIPYIIAEMDKSYKNLIISEDVYDTQYQSYPDRFLNHYLKRSMTNPYITYKLHDTISNMINDNPNISRTTNIYENNRSFYNLILSAHGSKSRSIEPVKGIGPKTMDKFIVQSLKDGLIQPDTTNMDMLISSLPNEIQDDIRINFECIDLSRQYSMLSREDLFSVEKQLIDRLDNNTLGKLNGGRVYNHPLMLNELTM